MNLLYYANLHIKADDEPSAHVLWVCRELARRGHRVLLFTYPFDQALGSGDFTAIRVPDFLEHFEQFYGYQRVLWQLCAYLAARFFRPDVIYQRDRMDDMFPLTLSRRLKAPLVIELNDHIPSERGACVGPQEHQAVVEARSERYQQARLLIAPTAGARDSAIQTFGVPAEKVVCIRRGVDVERFSPPAPYRRDPTRKLVLGYLFGYHPNLDLDTVLKAAAPLKGACPFELRLVTCSPNTERWRTRINELGIAPFVRFVPDVPPSQIPANLWKMDVCLAVFTRSYVQTYDGVESALQLWEYWASQRPVIATDLLCTASYYHHLEKRYLAVEPENPVVLAEAIQRLYRSPKLAEELACNGYEYVRHGHTWTDTAREIEEALKTRDGRRGMDDGGRIEAG